MENYTSSVSSYCRKIHFFAALPFLGAAFFFVDTFFFAGAAGGAAGLFFAAAAFTFFAFTGEAFVFPFTSALAGVYFLGGAFFASFLMFFDALASAFDDAG
jgi:hypothetical protein